MIASVRGLVASLSPDKAVVEVGGVGLSIICAPNTIADPADRRGGDSGDQPRGPGGLPDALWIR